MLAMADRLGRVWASIPGLANRARVPIEDAQTAIEKFLSPDKFSRTPDNEGRRIEPIDGGWRLLNHEKYRSIRDEEAILESKRKYINTRRAKEKAEAGVENVDEGRANAEADSDAEAKAVLKKKSSPVGKESGDHQKFIALWTECYPIHHAKNTYVFQGGKDGKAVSTLLASSKMSPDELIAVAIAAWKWPLDFNCGQASSIAGFSGRFNEIRNAITAPKMSGERSKPRPSV